MLKRIQNIVIMIVIGLFTLAELLYLAPEYKWGAAEVWTLAVRIFR
jgi:hypothetical protein